MPYIKAIFSTFTQHEETLMKDLPNTEPFDMSISEEIWDSKYRLKRFDGTIVDHVVEDTWFRIAVDLAKGETEDYLGKRDFFYEVLKNWLFLPAGRITAGAGSGRTVTMSNCFTMGTIPDSLDGIFEMLKEAALTMQQGGGIGYDFSTIRPKGAPVKGVESDASGPLSFMDVWDSMCRTIMSAGSRRGAMMATMRCDHPDIEAFIEAKSDPLRLRMFNLSVLITDGFMQAVKNDLRWELIFNGEVYKTIQARSLWDKLMKATYDYAEPGVIFIDRINRAHNLGYLETIATTNPCFTGDTNVWTSEGPVSFKDLAKTGDTVSVLTQDNNGSLVFRDMHKPRMNRESAPIFTVTFNNGTSVDCTGNHEFFLYGGGKCRADDLQEGHSIASVYRQSANSRNYQWLVNTKLGQNRHVHHQNKVVSVVKTEREEPVYCGTVNETGRFFVYLGGNNGVLVSNCGEKPMGPYASCILGSVNLARLVRNPFTNNAELNTNELRNVVTQAVRMLDNVNDVGGFPLPAQREKAFQDRQIGLGVTGLADLLIFFGLRYGSREAVEATKSIMSMIATFAYEASIELAKEKGAFPTFNADGFLREGTFASTLPDSIQDAIREHGIRNSLITSIAPTGTISMYAGNVSSGIEPIFATSYQRRILGKNGEENWQKVECYALFRYRQFCEKTGIDFDEKNLPDYFVTAQNLKPEDHVVMQATVQRYVDSSISKTVNLPEDISFDDFKDVYFSAYEQNCKGCTTYRPNAVTGSVLKVEAEDSSEPEGTMAPDAPLEPISIMDRPEDLFGVTYKLKWPVSDHALYITISDVMTEAGRRPFEIFVNSKNMDHYAWTVALTRMISAVFRRAAAQNEDVSFVVEELKAVFDPRGGAWMKGKYVPSILAAIGGVIEKHLLSSVPTSISSLSCDGSYPMPEPVEILTLNQREEANQVSLQPAPVLCPKCHSSNFINQGGCLNCADCGESNCN